MSKPTRLGGSFAPPLDKDKIARYRQLAKSADDLRVRDAMLPLCEMCSVFFQTPRSKRAAHTHPVGEFIDMEGNKRTAPAIVPLEEKEIERIWNHVPWDYECDALGTLFETLWTGMEERMVNGILQMVLVDPHARDLRNAAFHLLWFARELTRDREPLTNDMLG